MTILQRILIATIISIAPAFAGEQTVSLAQTAAVSAPLCRSATDPCATTARTVAALAPARRAAPARGPTTTRAVTRQGPSPRRGPSGKRGDHPAAGAGAGRMIAPD